MLKDILSISGFGGLYKFISQGRIGIIVESLEDKKRMNASATAKISALEDIAIFTETEDIPLKDVFKAIFEKENVGESISHKSSANELKSYFIEILPDYDRERVYVSDIKKVINWYNILHKLELLNFEEAEATDDTEEVKEVKEVKTKKKAAPTKGEKDKSKE
ncbi:MAG: DUF5606 domain-containing protein [Bacteroidales bacterium]|jgi:hypothetical protein|nr:DUF5606 domain-containing protein [Bacteroidales bacterium]